MLCLAADTRAFCPAGTFAARFPVGPLLRNSRGASCDGRNLVPTALKAAGESTTHPDNHGDCDRRTYHPDCHGDEGILVIGTLVVVVQRYGMEIEA